MMERVPADPRSPEQAIGALAAQRDAATSILVVDDMVDISDILETILSSEGWQVYSAANGNAGIAAAQDNQPDLIVLDVTLPDMSGFEVCRRLRAHKETALIPIIFLTAHASAQERVQGLDAGGNDYIAKPFHIDELLARVRAALRTKSIQDDLRETNVQLAAQAQTDPLTGLYNRRYVDERLQEEIIRAWRYGYPVSCCLLDIDHFKAVNDTHGHPNGDIVLRNVARILREQSRRDDIVARYGGEEFLVLLMRQDAQTALRIAEKIRRAVSERTIRLSGDEALTVTVSVGVSAGQGKSLSQETLIATADEALYRAKRSGRNQVCCPGQSPTPIL